MSEYDYYEPRWLASVISYHARVQSGDALLHSRRYADAAASDEAAREREPQISEGDPEHPILARPEALHNNQAIAEAKLGRRGAAVAAARKARGADPESPVFLETEGFALRRAGRFREAATAYRAAVRADPTAYTAWNDLGVLLARRGRLAEATKAFRHAIGAEADYALGWLNLGVALERRGPTQWLSARGAFGQALKADEDYAIVSGASSATTACTSPSSTSPSRCRHAGASRHPTSGRPPRRQVSR